MNTSQEMAMPLLSTAPYAILAGRSPFQQAVLLHLYHFKTTFPDACGLSIKSLAKLCGMSTAVTTDVCKELEREGLVQKITDQRTPNSIASIYMSMLSISLHHFTRFARYVNVITHVTRNYVTHNTRNIVISQSYYAARFKEINQQTREESSSTVVGLTEEDTLLQDSSFPSNQVTPQWVIETYQTIAAAKKFPLLKTVSDSRLRKIHARIKEYPTKEIWMKMFSALESSPYLAEEKWFSFDFVVGSSSSFEKVMNSWMEWKKVQSTSRNRLGVDVDFHSQLTQQGKEHAL